MNFLIELTFQPRVWYTGTQSGISASMTILNINKILYVIRFGDIYIH